MKVVSALLGVALVVVGGYVLHLSRELTGARAQLAQLQAGMDPSLALLPRTEVPARTAQHLSGQADVDAPAISGSGEPSPADRASALLAMVRAQGQSPEGRAQQRESSRALLRASMPDLDEALGLSPGELDHLLDVLLDSQERSSGVFAELRGSRLGGDDLRREVGARIEENERIKNQALEQLLGAKFADWKDYDQTRQAWAQRKDLRIVLKDANEPLTPQQESALIRALVDEERRFVQARSPGGAPSEQDIAWHIQRQIAAASTILSATQLQGYREMLDRREAMRRASSAALTAVEASLAGTEQGR